MVIRAERARLALLMTYYQATKAFSDPGAIALLHWYEEFCASQGGNTSKPLNLSDKELATLPELAAFPIAFGVPYIQLANNPELMDITALQELLILSKLGTLEHAIDHSNSPAMARALGEIRESLLNSKYSIKLSLKGLKRVPVYLQLLSNVGSITLESAYFIKNLHAINNLCQLRSLFLNKFHGLPHLKDLNNLPAITYLRIDDSCSDNILDGIENLPSLKTVFIKWSTIKNLEPLKKLPNLLEIDIHFCNKLQSLRLSDGFTLLQRIEIYALEELREFAIDTPCHSLRSITVTYVNNLECITGGNCLTNLEKIDLSLIDNLCRVTGLEEASALKSIEIGQAAPSVLRSILKSQIASGRYKSFLINGREIDLQHNSLPESMPITVRLLAHDMAAISAPSMLFTLKPTVQIASEHTLFSKLFKLVLTN